VDPAQAKRAEGCVVECGGTDDIRDIDAGMVNQSSFISLFNGLRFFSCDSLRYEHATKLL
jgi:hypothetical protein